MTLDRGTDIRLYAPPEIEPGPFSSLGATHTVDPRAPNRLLFLSKRLSCGDQLLINTSRRDGPNLAHTSVGTDWAGP